MIIEAAMTKLKAIMFGAEQIGKTELIKQLKDPKYINVGDNDCRPTLGCDFFNISLKNETSKDNNQIDFWDMSGLERYKSDLSLYANNIDLALYCVDLSKEIDEVRLEQIKTDIKQVREKSPNAKLILVGTKNDVALPNALTVIGKQLADIGFTAAVPTSARQVDGSKELLNILQVEANKKSLPKENDDFYHPKIDILKARDRCPKGSDLYLALDNLNNVVINELTIQKIEAIGKEAMTLITDLQNPSIPDKTNSINLFRTNCNEQAQGENHVVRSAIVVVVMTAIITAIAAMIGFGIGFALGAWTGPGAFLTGLAAGQASAVAVAGSTALVGSGTLPYMGHRLFKATPIQESINNIAEKAMDNGPKP